MRLLDLDLDSLELDTMGMGGRGTSMGLAVTKVTKVVRKGITVTKSARKQVRRLPTAHACTHILIIVPVIGIGLNQSKSWLK